MSWLSWWLRWQRIHLHCRRPRFDPWLVLGRSLGEGNSNPLQYSCLENPMDIGAWWTTIHGVIKSQTWILSLSIQQMLALVTWLQGWLLLLWHGTNWLPWTENSLHVLQALRPVLRLLFTLSMLPVPELWLFNPISRFHLKIPQCCARC